ncbi:MAG: hypothetical protein A4S12_08230 [Proteobacteria bacterium SG_bin5]|nr:molybdopterin-dependent oxidoreductase [Sphingomonas sp.]OQW41556.1 MAG: hypothetical protein A4S12_08230 [Proteobacteria bacterium SG_bin5]
MLSRRLALAGLGGLAAAPGLAREVRLGFANGARPLTRAFPEKGEMILQRTRAPLLETPFEAFDAGLLTPNDRFYVRWHYQDIPLAVSARDYRLKVSGAVARPLALTLGELLKLPRVELVAVNQCSGNSRGFVSPRVAGAQWGHGAMGCARWTGVPLKAVLARAGVKRGAVAVRFGGLDAPPPEAPRFLKSLDLDHAMDGEVMIAFAMNGAPLPLLNGYPIRLIVPGWYSTYWVKALSSIELLTAPDDNFWMKTAYRIPATPDGGVAPGTTQFESVPINKMPPRSFVTNLAEGAVVPPGPRLVRGIAFGGASGVAKVELSRDGGASWQAATLGPDQGKYGFRAWQATTDFARGAATLAVRCTAEDGRAQPMRAVWNPGGYLYNAVERIRVMVA